MIPFDLAVFDIAGTTVRDEKFVALALQTALANAGHEIEIPRLDEVMGLAKPVAIGLVLGLDPESEEVQAIHDDFRTEMIRFYREDERVQPIEGAAEVFAMLQDNGVAVALDTGFDREITDIILQRLGWDSGVLDSTITADEVQNGRPAPDMIQALMSELRIASPNRVIKLGDTVSDMREGKAAGCGLVIGVLSGTDSEEALSAEKPDFVVSSIADLLEFDFNELFARESTPV